MAQWRVQLKGNLPDLQDARDILNDHDPKIVQDGTDFYLTSKEWEQLNAEEIHRRAKRFVQSLGNAAYLHFGDTSPLTLGAVIEIDDQGHRNQVIFSEGVEFSRRRSRVRGYGESIGPDNKPLEIKQEHAVIKILKSSQQNANVEVALRFFHKGDWYSLYKAYELVRDDVGGKEKHVLSRKLIEKPTLSRFTGTAQSRAALGDDARHASKKYEPPKNPMSLTEAKSVIGTLLQKWINSL